jgi:hypothetical protein
MKLMVTSSTPFEPSSARPERKYAVGAGSLGEAAEQVIVDVRRAVLVQAIDLLGDHQLTFAGRNVRAGMGLAINPREALRSQRQLAPHLVIGIEANVQIAVDQEIDRLVEGTACREHAVACIERRIAGRQFAREQTRPFRDFRIGVLGELAQTLQAVEPAKLLHRPKRVPTDLAILVVLDDLAQKLDGVGFVPVDIFVERLLAHHRIGMFQRGFGQVFARPGVEPYGNAIKRVAKIARPRGRIARDIARVGNGSGRLGLDSVGVLLLLRQVTEGDHTFSDAYDAVVTTLRACGKTL